MIVQKLQTHLNDNKKCKSCSFCNGTLNYGYSMVRKNKRYNCIIKPSHMSIIHLNDSACSNFKQKENENTKDSSW